MGAFLSIKIGFVSDHVMRAGRRDDRPDMTRIATRGAVAFHADHSVCLKDKFSGVNFFQDFPLRVWNCSRSSVVVDFHIVISIILTVAYLSLSGS